jgi:hypothetical protein
VITSFLQRIRAHFIFQVCDHLQRVSSGSEIALPATCVMYRRVFMLTANKVLILSLDNAAMIAWASMNRFLAGDTDPDDLEIRAQWSIEDLQDVVSPIH